MPIDDDGGGIVLGFSAAVYTEDFVVIVVLASVVDPGLPRAVTDNEIQLTVVVAVTGVEEGALLGSHFGTGRFESQCRSRCTAGRMVALQVRITARNLVKLRAGRASELRAFLLRFRRRRWRRIVHVVVLWLMLLVFLVAEN